MKNTLKKIAFILIALAVSVQYSSAQSVLTELPFGIEIGKTTNSEINKRGTCIVMKPKGENDMRCEKYDVAGKFFVYSSHDEIVNKVEFNGRSQNILPIKWRNLEMKFGRIGRSGTLDMDFINIIKSQNAKNIHTEIINNEEGNSVATEITFNIDAISYSIFIRTDPNEVQYIGLEKISITEAY